MKTEEINWAQAGRCPDCGRFMKRGLVNWMEHAFNTCRFAERNRRIKEGITKRINLQEITKEHRDKNRPDNLDYIVK
jgi:hypothetical protein